MKEKVNEPKERLKAKIKNITNKSKEFINKKVSSEKEDDENK